MLSVFSHTNTHIYTHTERGVECGGHGWHGNHLLILYISLYILNKSSYRGREKINDYFLLLLDEGDNALVMEGVVVRFLNS